MKKEIWLLAMLVVTIIILLASLLWPMSKKTTGNPQETQTTQPQITEGIQINYLTPNQEVSLPLKITGSVNNGGWSGFEGQVGTVQLLDNKGNKLASAVLKATTDWTKSPVEFESNITFTGAYKGPATLLFSNENPSGMPDKDKKFGLAVIIK